MPPFGEGQAIMALHLSHFGQKGNIKHETQLDLTNFSWTTSLAHSEGIRGKLRLR